MLLPRGAVCAWLCARSVGCGWLLRGVPAGVRRSVVIRSWFCSLLGMVPGSAPHAFPGLGCGGVEWLEPPTPLRSLLLRRYRVDLLKVAVNRAPAQV